MEVPKTEMVKIVITTKALRTLEVYTKTKCTNTNDILKQALCGGEFVTFFTDKEGTGVIAIRVDGIESAYIALFQD